ncbi:MAG: ABC transporter permease [Acidobacteriota bacterium]
MTRDILTVVWKEWKELLWAGGLLRGGRVGLFILLVIFGVFLPYQTGRAWVESAAPLFYWAWLPLMLVSGVVADSFAGERERHTLETLLASRLPDRAVLFGKLAAALSYGWGLVLGMLGLSLVTVNLTHRGDGLLLFAPHLAVGAPVMSFLGAGLAATAGVLVSLRAPTVRQAAQSLNVAILLLIFIPVFGIQMLPAGLQSQLAASALSYGVSGILIAAGVVLALLDGLLLAAVLARFRRAKLILD